MTLFGLALVPRPSDVQAIVAFRQEAGALIGGPMLGTSTNLPHVSILQCPFNETDLTGDLLNAIAQEWHESPQSAPPVGLISGLLYKPVDWVFAQVNAPCSVALQHIGLARMSPLIQAAQIDMTRDTSEYSQSERTAYQRYGYRYVGDAFRPHITLGRVSDGLSTPPKALIDLYRDTIDARPLVFDQLAFYRAGEYGVFAQALHSCPLLYCF